MNAFFPDAASTDSSSFAARAAKAAAIALALTAVTPSTGLAAAKKTTFPVASGTTVLTVDQALLDVLSRSGVGVSPIAPTVAAGSYTAAPAAGSATLPATQPQTLTLKVTSGKIDLKKKTITVAHGGGLKLGGALPLEVNLTNAGIATKSSAGALTADTLVGKQTGLLDLSGVKLPKTAKKGQTLSIKGISAMFKPSIVGPLQTFVPTLPPAPLKFGTVDLKLKLR